MEASGTVTADMGEYANKLTSYGTIISELSSSWKGKSYDNISSQAGEFVSEYNAIQNQMSHLANACSLYASYEEQEKQISETETARAQAASQNKSTASLDTSLKNMRDNLANIKKSILDDLSAASSPTLEATSLAATISTNTGIRMTSTGGNQAFVDNIMGEEGNTISDYPGLGFHDGLWCADFASEMLIRNGFDIPRCSVAGDGDESYDIFHALRERGSAVHLDLGSSYMGYSDSSEYDPNYSPQPGDVVLFNWDYDGSTDHVGIVIRDNGDGTIETIEGNTSGPAGSSCVAVKTRDRNLVYGYATPV